jgi:hypothetical protein
MEQTAKKPDPIYYAHKLKREELQNIKMLRRDLGKKYIQIEYLPLLKDYLFDFHTNKDKDKLINSINKNSMLTKNTYLHSTYESMFAKELLKNFDNVLYEPLKLPIILNNRRTEKKMHKIEDSPSSNKNNQMGLINIYNADFWLPFNYINGKGIIIEPHCNRFINSNYIKKLSRIRDHYNLYIILATMSDYYQNYKSNKKVSEYVDELWLIPSNHEGKENLRNYIKDLENRTEYKSTSSLSEILAKLKK